jgi:hypothetical protein
VRALNVAAAINAMVDPNDRSHTHWQIWRVELAAVFLCVQVQSKFDDAWLSTRQTAARSPTRAHDSMLPSPGPGGGASSFSAASSQYPNLG